MPGQDRSDEKLESRLSVYVAEFQDWQEAIEIVIEVEPHMKDTFWQTDAYWLAVVVCVQQEIANQIP